MHLTIFKRGLGFLYKFERKPFLALRPDFEKVSRMRKGLVSSFSGITIEIKKMVSPKLGFVCILATS